MTHSEYHQVLKQSFESSTSIHSTSINPSHDQQNKFYSSKEAAQDEAQNLLQGESPQEQKSFSVKGIFFMILTVISFHLLRASAKLCYTVSNVSTWEINAFRAGINGILNLILIAFLPDVHLPGVPKHLVWYVVARCVVGFISLCLMFAALQYLNFSTSIVIYFIHPMMTAVASRIFLKQKLSIYDVIALLFSFCGAVLFAFPQIAGQKPLHEQKKVQNQHIGIVMAVCQTLFTAATYLIIRKMGKQIHFTIAPTYFGIFGCIIFTIFSLINYVAFGHVTKYNSELWLYLCMAGVVGFFGQNFLSLALQNEKAGRLAGLEYFQIVLGFLFEIAVFKGDVGLAEIIGTVLISGSSFLVTVLKCTGKIN